MGTLGIETLVNRRGDIRYRILNMKVGTCINKQRKCTCM